MAGAMPLPLMLNPSLDVRALAARFASAGRVQVAAFLAPESAEAWHAHLVARDDWLRVINAGDTVYELGRAAQAALTPEASARLDEGVYAGARRGFQYRFSTIRVADAPEHRAASADPLAAFAAFMSDEPVRNMSSGSRLSGDRSGADCSCSMTIGGCTMAMCRRSIRSTCSACRSHTACRR